MFTSDKGQAELAARLGGEGGGGKCARVFIQQFASMCLETDSAS